MSSISRASRAYSAPFFLFMALLALSDGVHAAFKSSRFFLLNSPKYWIFPLQTILCGALLFYYRRHYPLTKPRKSFRRTGTRLAEEPGLPTFVGCKLSESGPIS